MTKKILAVVMAIAMLLCMAPITLAAEGNVAKDKNGVEYATLAEAVANGTSPITLLRDAEGAGVVINRSITIDFAGYTYTFTEGVGSTGTESNGFQILAGSYANLKNGTLNVAAESADKFYTLIQTYAGMTITNMTLDGTNLDKWSKTDGDSYVLSVNSGEIRIAGNTNIIANNDGNKAFAFDSCKYASYEAPFVKVDTTGTISGIVEITGGDLEVEAGTFVSDTDCFYMTSGYLWLGEDVTVTAGECGVYLRGGELHTYADITTTGSYGAIQGNGNYAGDVYVHGGSITSENDLGIYFPQDGFLCIFDGTITGTTAVYAKQGQIFVNGGTLVATGEAKDFVTNGNGADATGDALVIETGHYGNLYAQVDGGTFVSENAAGIASYAENENYTARTGFVNNAVIDAPVVDKAVFAENADVVIVNPVVVNGVGYATVADAVAKAADGAVINLVADVTETKAVTVTNDITINLNGNTWTLADTNNYGVVIKDTLTINGDGEVIVDTAYGFGTSTTCKGGITFNGGTYTGTENNVYLIGAFAGTVEIIDGTFVSDYCVVNSFAGYTANVIIRDGSFTVTDYETYLDAAAILGINVEVYGGTYSNAVAEEYCAEGFIPADNGDGTFGVKEGEYVAEVNGVKYETLAEAVEAAEPGATVTLLTDATGAALKIDKDITIDFGGNTYTITNPAVGSTGTTTLGMQLLKDNDIVLKNGKLEVAAESATDFAMLIQNYANLTIEDMILDGTNLDRHTIKDYDYSYVISNNSGEVAINGATDIIANDDGTGYAFDVCKYASYAVPTVTVNTTGTINGIVVVEGGNLVAEAGTFVSDGYAIRVIDGTADLAEGVSVTGDCAIFVKGGSLTTAADVTSIGDFAAISGNGYYAGDITITGGTITDDGVAVYFPQNGKLTITGGTITGATAVYAKQGTVAITGGTLIANGEAVDYKYNGNGANATGDALVIDTCGYGDIDVTVTGGTFESANADAIASYATTNYEAATGFVSGGTFNTAIADELAADDLAIVENADGTYGVATAVAEINGVGYASLEAAAEAAVAGDTITLVADVTFEADGGAGAENATYIDLTNVTLDLNDYTINANRYNPVFTGDNFTITNGKFMTKGADYGLFLLEATNVVIDGITSNAGINIQEASANVTIKNCDITGDDYYAIFVADVKNVVIESGSYIAKEGKKSLYVYFNTDTVTVKGGTWSDTKDVAKYLAEGLEIVENADGTFGVQEKAAESGFLTLKAQTNKAGSQLRFITTIDNLKYKEVGFVITNAANPAQSVTKTSKTVYSSIVAGGKTYTAAQISGDEAMNYILTYTITGIPAAAQGTRYLVKPFVVTLSGETVYGAEKEFCVADMIG